MIHGDDKAKEMARSILPSRWRGAAKMRASIHRSARRQVGLSLRLMARDPSAWDDGVDLGEEAELEVSPFVNRRRGADKLNHFERWAVERTRALPKEGRLGHLRGLLPGGLIGEHAMTHLKMREELAVHGFRPLPWSMPRKLLMDRGELAEVLRELLEVGDGVRSLHLAMKQAERVAQGGSYPLKVGNRRLRGQHDVLPFLDWLERDRTSRFVVDGFCRVFKESGDVEVAMRKTVERQVVPMFDVMWTPRRAR